MADLIKSGVVGFGIKEVADVAFYEVGSVTVDPATGAITGGQPLFVLDTLKVSTIENTAEQADAKGGKGNAPLIIWDYGREITITLQDAVLSMETLSMMFENGVGAEGDNEIIISANTFPGTYAIVGKTFARNVSDGKDHLFTWYVPKAKVNSEVTLTMEAEGDPTVFDMNLRVLRDADGAMVKMYRDTTAVANYDIDTAFTVNEAENRDTYIVTVTDDGNPVSGAIVTLGDYTDRTNLSGKAIFEDAKVDESAKATAKYGNKTGTASATGKEQSIALA